jgi:hypothetical protein
MGQHAMPSLKSGLQLQRCTKKANVRSPADIESEYKKISEEILAGLPADSPARKEMELDLMHLWSVYEEESKVATDADRQAELQRNLSDNLKRMKETAPLQVELRKRYGIDFTARESGRLEKGEIRLAFRAWTQEELKEVDRVLSQVPADYLKNIRKIERSPAILDASVSAKGDTPPPHAAAVWQQKDQKLEIYDLFFRAEAFQRPGLLLHEIGHSTVTSEDPKTTGGFASLPPAEWMALSDWHPSTAKTLKDDLKIDDKQATELIKQLTTNKQSQRNDPRPVEINGRMVVYDKYEGRLDKAPTQFLHYAKKEDKFVSAYARTHPAEDLAESFSRYLHDPKITLLQSSARSQMGEAKWGYLEKHYPQKLKGEF